MKRFSPYVTYTQNGQLIRSFTAPDGQKKASAKWLGDRIAEIRSIFNRFKFREYQQEIVESILTGNDTFAIMPTGSGKSYCFQAPAVFFPGITLVVTPLIALIENQVAAFNKNAYPVYHVNATNYYENLRFKAIYPYMNDLSLQDTFAEILNPGVQAGRQVQYKLLYVSPERLNNPKFLRALDAAEKAGLQISQVVIDEVHCTSQWGFEFRESYLHIPNFIKQRPVRPIISAFTATATPKDIVEIKNILNFPTDPQDYAKKKYKEFFHVKKRQNLTLNVIPCSDDDSPAPNRPTREAALVKLLEANPDKVCIIYRTTTVGVDELYETLCSHEQFKNKIVKYHAQMPQRDRVKSKNAFLRHHSSQNVMIATKAFGMGIDKDDIAMIIHYDLPRSLEDYYQEAGRAGRDVASVPTARCHLLYADGPAGEKGTLQFTLNWVTAGKDSTESSRMPVASQFSNGIKDNVYFWSYYRLCCTFKAVTEHSHDLHDYVIEYLRNNFADKAAIAQAAADLDSFYRYVRANRSVPLNPDALLTGADAKKFLDLYSPQATQRAAEYHAELKRLTGEVNELHINNTYLANLLRHKPHKYQLDVPYVLSEDTPNAGQEWKSKKNKKVRGALSRSLRKTDIRESAAFIFVDDPNDCAAYVNAAWQARRKPSPYPRLIFAVDGRYLIGGVLKTREGVWQPIDDKKELQPYKRYLGCDIKGLFPKTQFKRWRDTKYHIPGDPTDHADDLFAYVTGARNHELIFTIHGNGGQTGEPLSYFDLCVLDAVYSIETTRKETVYVQTVWEVLTGRNPNYSSHEKLAFRTAIQNSIDKMRSLSISIYDNQCPLKIKKQPFLPLIDKPKNQKGYAYTEIPPLFQYAEAIGGEIIRVPVTLLNVAKIEKATLWREDFRTEFSPDPANNKPVFTNKVKKQPSQSVTARDLYGLAAPKEQRRLARIQSNPYAFSPSIENALLCHYLVHRIAISKNRKRGNFLRISTIKDIVGSRDDACLFNKKVVAVIDHYQKIGYLNAYYAYITDHPYQLTDGGTLLDTAYFQIEADETVKYWQLRGANHLFCSDFTLNWSAKHNESLQDDNSNFELKTALTNALNAEGKTLTAAAWRELAAFPIGRIDGVVLQHK